MVFTTLSNGPGFLRLDIDVHLECAEISLRLFLSPCHLTGSHCHSSHWDSAPSLANARAAARPIPELEPVTKATLPSMLLAISEPPLYPLAFVHNKAVNLSREHTSTPSHFTRLC